MTTIDLESFIGPHELSGAYFDATSCPEYQGSDAMVECQVLRFTLDGTHYEAVECPEDEYRSSLRHISETDVVPCNSFEAVKVIGEMRIKTEHGEDCVLVLKNPVSGKPVIEIGTADVDDYYPGFVAYFHPENLKP